jgi:hypothetical protein
VAAAIAARAGYAQAKEAALSFGAQLAGLEDLTEGANVIDVNGERFHRASVFSKDPVGKVLDRIQADCQSQPGLLGQLGPEASIENKRRKLPFGANILSGIVRHEETGRGMVACFTDVRKLGMSGLADAAARFAKSSNLAEFGHFRYAFAHHTQSGETFVTTLWAETDLNLSTMFPARGDAAGDDSHVLPRPKASRRTLAASAQGQPYAVRLYDSSESPLALQNYYKEWMAERGWVPAGKVEGKGAGYLRADGYEAIVSVNERNGRTTVALTEAGRDQGSIVSTSVEAQP